MESNKHILSFNRKLFLSVILLFLVFVGCFLAYQYQREKEYKIELLHTKLQDYNERLYEKLQNNKQNIDSVLDYYIRHYSIQDLRATVIRPDGKVIYDSYEKNKQRLKNHLGRKEVQTALKNGSGYDVRRTSATTGVSYFYSATAYNNYIIRTALPYNIDLKESLKIDPGYLWFTAIITLALIFIFYKFTNKLGDSINQLREFAMRADRNEPIETDMESKTPQNELGEISRHIIQIYKRLHETKEALYIEREKLITHLQISHEGLGIFTNDKKEILVNNLFTQYGNLISDSNLLTSEDVFNITEFHSITNFINKVHKKPIQREEKRMSISINKNGRTFTVECIIFQDMSFEISINDITMEEEQIRLKRQLTQNIAHELKTPVSSIQGYLETIVNNDNIPQEKMKIFLERCYAQSNRLSRLLRDISVLTRMDEASNMIDMEKVDINVLITNITNEVALELEERRITVINLLHKNIQIRGNYSLLYSIFRNLTDNAIAYAGTNISIHINCFREDETFYYFSFADTGVGVSPEHLNRLFERFYRIDKGRSRKLGGTGLGLAIVKNAVIIHGGSISAKNNQGGGLEFVFTLAKEK
ncbi:HAMP domain-containing sensor histidine kinase [uncultured Bacteroides sp.]|uniref:sensor histidine kinase n=1 Tax=uncultured Bacteroides sp. TaxID=162156 RepID=UPI002AAA725D|nr:HAMP domain-containing sensor histidine kinase [uncultured Bacteroides sp.]